MYAILAAADRKILTSSAKLHVNMNLTKSIRVCGFGILEAH
jgi:hypothetical protein